MKQKSKRQKTLKKHQKSKRKIGLLDRMNLWFVQHSTIAWLLDASVLFFSALGILFLLYGTTLIPSPYRELHYSFPLYLNIVLLVNASYHSFLRNFRKDWISLRNFANMFLYPNVIACVLQLTIGMTSKRGRRLLPIWGIFTNVKKDKEYAKCLFKGNHHKFIFKNKLVFFVFLTKF